MQNCFYTGSHYLGHSLACGDRSAVFGQDSNKDIINVHPHVHFSIPVCQASHVADAVMSCF